MLKCFRIIQQQDCWEARKVKYFSIIECSFFIELPLFAFTDCNIVVSSRLALPFGVLGIEPFSNENLIFHFLANGLLRPFRPIKGIATMTFIVNPFIEENWKAIFRISASTDFSGVNIELRALASKALNRSRACLERMLIYNCVARAFYDWHYTAHHLKWQLQKFIPAQVNLERICIDVVEMRNSVKITFSSLLA